MTNPPSDSNDARKPTLRAAAKRDNFGAAPRKPARGNAPLARFIKREPSAYELEVRQAASAAMQKLERAAARPEPEPQPPRYARERRDFEPRYEPRRDQRFESRNDNVGGRYERAAPRAPATGDSPAARALSALANAAPSTYRPSEDPTRQHRYERSNDRNDNRRYNDVGDRSNDRPRDGYEQRFEPRSDRRLDGRGDQRANVDRRNDRYDEPRGSRHEALAPHKTAHLGPKTDAEKAGGVRLNKRLAELGMCSRREGDVWIEKGWVLVNGAVAAMGQTVFEADNIEVADAAQAEQAQQVTILLHKPVGYVSGLPEDGHESAATLIGPQSQWVQDPVRTRFQARFTRGLAPAGRLDIDSTGLIVFTQNGLVARQLIGENSDVEKEYLVRVHWVGDNPHADSEVVQTDVASVFPADRLSLLCEGLSLDGQALRPAQVSWQNPEQLRFVLKEGKKRQIRRMCEQVGLKVVGLKRIRIGTVVLGNLPVGQWRFLAPAERFSG